MKIDHLVVNVNKEIQENKEMIKTYILSDFHMLRNGKGNERL